MKNGQNLFMKDLRHWQEQFKKNIQKQKNFQNYQKNYTYKLERARELEQHRTSTNPILLNLHKENAE